MLPPQSGMQLVGLFSAFLGGHSEPGRSWGSSRLGVCSGRSAVCRQPCVRGVQLQSASQLEWLCPSCLGWPVAWLHRRARIFSLGTLVQSDRSSPGIHVYLIGSIRGLVHCSDSSTERNHHGKMAYLIRRKFM